MSNVQLLTISVITESLVELKPESMSCRSQPLSDIQEASVEQLIQGSILIILFQSVLHLILDSFVAVYWLVNDQFSQVTNFLIKLVFEINIFKFQLRIVFMSVFSVANDGL